MLFLVFIKTTFFGKDCYKRFVFLHYSARFFKYFWLLNNVEISIFYAEIWIFFFNRHFLIIMGFNPYNPEALNIGTVFQGPGFESRWRCMFFTLIVSGKVCSHHIPLDRFFGNSLAKLAGEARYVGPPESRPKPFFSGRHLQLVGVYSRAVHHREVRAQQSDLLCLLGVGQHHAERSPAATGNNLCVVCCAKYNKYLKKHPATVYGNMPKNRRKTCHKYLCFFVGSTCWSDYHTKVQFWRGAEPRAITCGSRTTSNFIKSQAVGEATGEFAHCQRTLPQNHSGPGYLRNTVCRRTWPPLPLKPSKISPQHR